MLKEDIESRRDKYREQMVYKKELEAKRQVPHGGVPPFYQKSTYLS